MLSTSEVWEGSNFSGNLQVCGVKYSIIVPLFVQIWSSGYKFKASIHPVAASGPYILSFCFLLFTGIGMASSD